MYLKFTDENNIEIWELTEDLENCRMVYPYGDGWERVNSLLSPQSNRDSIIDVLTPEVAENELFLEAI